jgi:hypothetical protein
MRKQLVLSAVASITTIVGLSGNAHANGFCASNSCAAETVVQATQTSPAFSSQNGGAGVGVDAESSSGYGLYALTLSTSSSEAAIYALADTLGAAYGVQAVVGSGNAFDGTSSSGNGVYATTAGGGGQVGVWGNNSGTGGSGVFGVAIDGFGVQGKDTGGGHGVQGEATGANAGIGVYGKDSTTSGTGYAGYFSGNVYATGNITCGGTCNSDVRLKENVQPLVGALAQMLKLRGVTFEWKNPAEHQNHTGSQTGVVAQEVEKVFPQWVYETPDKGVKNVDPDARTVLALTVEAFREQQAEIDELKAARHPIIAFNPNWGIFAAGLVIGGVLLLNKRHKSQDAA